MPVPGGTWWRPPWTATAVGGMHPTGMHSCLENEIERRNITGDAQEQIKNIQTSKELPTNLWVGVERPKIIWLKQQFNKEITTNFTV